MKGKISEQEPSGSDKRLFHQAIKWSFVMSWGVAAGSTATMMVMAAILGPEAYGLVALASIYVLLAQLFVDPGISQALIQKKAVTQDHLNSAFGLVTGVGFGLFAATILFVFFWTDGEKSDLFQIISWLSVCIPIHALTIVHIALLRRQMNFKALAIRDNVSVVSGAIVGISLALLDFGYWSLVGQQLVEAVVGLALLWRLSEWKPRVRFKSSAIRDISSFSAASFMSQLGIFAYMRGDAAVMGYFFGPAAVGIYRLALRLMNICSDVGTQAVNFAALPEMARHQADMAKLRAATLKSLHVAALASLGLLGMLAATSNDLVLLMGPEWQDARAPLLVLCTLAAFQVVSIITTSMLQAVGRPLLNAKLTWVWGILAVGSTVGIGLLFANDSPQRQVMAVCIVHVAFGAFLHFPTYTFLMKRICGISMQDVVVAVAPTAIAAISAFAVAEHLRSYIVSSIETPIMRLPIVGAAALAAFGAILLLLDRRSRLFVAAFIGKLHQQH